MEFEDEMPAKATIVDVLNEDCWRIILGYIHIKGIIRSERVSRKWQNVILQYLEGAYFSVEGPIFVQKPSHKFHVLKLKNEDDPHELDQITRKWGPKIKKANCYNEAGLEVLARNCPNLEHILFVNIKGDVFLNGAQPQANFIKLKTVHIESYNNFVDIKGDVFLNGAQPQANFIKLKTVHIESYNNITDEHISNWIDHVIEELYMEYIKALTGRFLVNMQFTNLRALSLSNCPALEYQHLFSAVCHFTCLKKLVLMDLPMDIFKNTHKILDKLPNLEDLCLRRAKPFGFELAEAISRLELKRLDLSYNELLNDERLEIIARGCGRLREFVVDRCLEVTVRGISAVCRVSGPALRALHVGSNHKIDDHHVETFITACPNLTLLDLVFCMGITENLVDKVGELTRGRPRLRLMVDSTMVEGFHEDRYPWLFLDFGVYGDYGW